ncbi:MAG: HDOD domain-containing protein, partial [Undibacterium sp.]|nr:HDOD domain-containing protein [Undibacterium sp.]
LAKNLSSIEGWQQAQLAGFNLFSGDFAFDASPSTRSEDATARTRLLKLLSLVSIDAESKELEVLFKQDPTLSYMLFKLVSSAAFAQTVTVSSFAQAINLLGRRQLQRWLQLLLYAKPSGQGVALNPLMLRAAFRASFMENMWRHNGANRDQQDAAFMVGIFSLLDLLFATPIADILKPLSLPEEVHSALTQRTGPFGKYLQLTELADRYYNVALEDLLKQCQLSIEDYYENLTQAYVWVNQVCQDL